MSEAFRQPDRVSPRQFTAAAFVGLLSPLLRRFPRTLAERAGRGAWLTPLLALPVLALLWALTFLLWRKNGGRSWPELLQRALGDRLGRGVSLLYALWLALYAGVLLRSGALRFQGTVYPGAPAWAFAVCGAALCGLAASGSFRDVARSAMVLRPLLVPVPVLLFFLSLKSFGRGLLLPLGASELTGAAMGGLELANLLAAAFCLAPLRDRCPAPLRLRDWGGWVLGLLALTGLMAVSCLGVFGPRLTAELRYPFFMLARDACGGASLERFEPLIVAVWVLADFVFLSCLLKAAAACLAPAGEGAEPSGAVWPAACCAAAALIAALLLPGDTARFSALSERLVPLLSALFSAALPLAVLCIGALRRRL